MNVADVIHDLGRVAAEGRHDCVFSDPDMEAAAQAIVKCHRRADRAIAAAMRVQRKAEEETKRLLARAEAPPRAVEALVGILVAADAVARNKVPLPEGLSDALAEAILALPNAAVLDLERRCGRDPAETAARMRAVVGQVLTESRRARGAE